MNPFCEVEDGHISQVPDRVYLGKPGTVVQGEQHTVIGFTVDCQNGVSKTIPWP